MRSAGSRWARAPASGWDSSRRGPIDMALVARPIDRAELDRRMSGGASALSYGARRGARGARPALRRSLLIDCHSMPRGAAGGNRDRRPARSQRRLLGSPPKRRAWPAMRASNGPQRALCRRCDRRAPWPAGRRHPCHPGGGRPLASISTDGRTPGVGFDRIACLLEAIATGFGEFPAAADHPRRGGIGRNGKKGRPENAGRPEVREERTSMVRAAPHSLKGKQSETARHDRCGCSPRSSMGGGTARRIIVTSACRPGQAVAITPRRLPAAGPLPGRYPATWRAKISRITDSENRCAMISGSAPFWLSFRSSSPRRFRNLSSSTIWKPR